MNRKIIFAVLVCCSLSIGTILLLFALSGEMRDRHDSFLRQFPPHPVMEGDTLDLKYTGYYLAGGSERSIYLGNSRVPLHVLKVNTQVVTDTQFVSLNIPGIKRQKFWSARVQIDSPYFYLADGVIPVIAKGTLSDGMGQRTANDSVFFQTITALSSGSFAVRSVNNRTKENMLGKISPWPPFARFDDLILVKQLDGIFCTDGMMSYDRKNQRLVYLYHYRNEYTVMDTNLNLRYRANTIDTNFRAKIKPATISSGNTHMLASPSAVVNKRSCASNGLLFVQSGLLAKNEPAEVLHMASVIDVYDLRTGKYRFSFYLYDYEGKKLTDFAVFGNTLAVLYGKTLQLYRLRPKIFSNANTAL